MLNGDSSQASEATPVEVTKKALRDGVWKHFQKNALCVKPNYSFNRIPRFVGTEEAATELTKMDEFKNAQHIMVNPDRAQDVVRLTCLQNGKTVYVLPPRVKTYLMTKVNVKEDPTDEDYANALLKKGLEESGNQIGLDDNIKLDMIVIGSVAVSKDGNRIGRGQSKLDLYLGLLKQINFITPETTIVTVVHDSQVIDTIPPEVMSPHDFPVDVIVTPNQIIKCTGKKADRPTGIVWNLITEKKLNNINLLSTFRDKEIESGNSCVLKEPVSEQDSDNDGVNGRPRRFYGGRRQGPRRPQQNGATHSESENIDNGDGEGEPKGRGRNQRSFYRRYPRYRRSTGEDGSITKHTYRNKAWQLLQRNRVATTARGPYSRIPGYRGAEDTALVLRQLPQYKDASSVLVGYDKTHEPIRMACLEDGKKLYILMPKIRNKLIMRIDLPEGENKPELKDVVTRPGMEQYGTKLEPTEEVTLDLLVFGSLVVSKEGFRIGTGSGHEDLSYALLRDMNAVTADTPIFTTVHDYQVFETFPSDLFAEHDIPVDMIVTPTQSIKVSPEKAKPSLIKWDLITPRFLKYTTLLSDKRDKLIEAGEACELKKEDENTGNQRRRHYRNNNFSESEPNEMGDTEGGDYRRQRGPRRFNRQRRSTNDKGEMEGGAESGGNMSPDTTTIKKRTNPYRKNKTPIDFSIKLTNISKNMRVRDLRTALQERSVKPSIITWKGFNGFCYLHFFKQATPQTPTQGEGDIQSNADTIVESLANLTLYPTVVTEETTTQEPILPNKLVVQLVPPRIKKPEQIVA